MNSISRERQARLTLMRAVAPGAPCPNVRAYVHRHGPVRALQTIWDRTAPTAVAAEIQVYRPDISDDLAAIDSGRLRFVIPEDAEWPLQLASPADDPLDFTPPLGLWVAGDSELSDVRASLAMLGAHSPTDDTRAVTINTARHHAAGGTTIVAPAQWGVGLRAISAAVNADHRATPAAVVVAACGLDILAATQSTLIRAVVAAGGLIVSEHTLDTEVRVTHQFDASARLAAALANATYILDAGANDPAMEGACTAIALGRPLYALPTQHDYYDTSGTDRLLERRAAAPAARPDHIAAGDLVDPRAVALAAKEA